VEGSHNIQPEDIILSGQKIHVWKGGAGFPLLMLHPAWGDAEMSWRSVWEELSGSFAVIAPDLPGFGQSSQLTGPSLQAMAKRLKELLDFLHVKRVAVAGNSFGAAVARQIAGDFPECVSRLILINGGYLPHMPAPVRKLISVPFLNRRTRLLMRHFSFSSHALKKSFVDPSKLPPGFFETVARNAPAYSSVVFDVFLNITKPLPAPVVPTFLIWGAQDGLTPLKRARRLQKKIQGALLISIEGAGHMPQLERPAEFVTAIMGVGKNAEEAAIP
jgi:pimeloyl-ACP methyl ester carboxylesterase